MRWHTSRFRCHFDTIPIRPSLVSLNQSQLLPPYRSLVALCEPCPLSVSLDPGTDQKEERGRSGLTPSARMVDANHRETTDGAPCGRLDAARCLRPLCQAARSSRRLASRLAGGRPPPGEQAAVSEPCSDFPLLPVARLNIPSCTRLETEHRHSSNPTLLHTAAALICYAKSIQYEIPNASRAEARNKQRLERNFPAGLALEWWLETPRGIDARVCQVPWPN